MIDLDKKISDRYSVKEEIGSGSFGRVFRLQHIKKNKSFAIKVDIRQKGNVLLEAKILSDLQGGLGIPKLHKYGSTDQYSYMIIELLGMTVNAALKQNKCKFSLGTVVSVILQLLSRIEYVHSKGYLHRDLKPHQILIGKNPKVLYLTDFGLARRFEVNNYHISYQQSCPRVGNATFSSLNNHSGSRQSRRDDLESISYISVYLLKGRLPWQSTHHLTTNSKWQYIFQAKSNLKIEEVCSSCPKEFELFLKYCRQLKFEEKPDYKYIQSLFTNLQAKENLSVTALDWIKEDSSISVKPTYMKSVSENNGNNLLTVNKQNVENSFSHNKRKKLRSKTVTVLQRALSNNDSPTIQKAELSKDLSKGKTMFDESTYNSLSLTPRNIYPEMKNRRFKVKEEVKIIEKCKII